MDLRAIIKNAYCKDTICAKIIAQPDAYPRFSIWGGLIWTKKSTQACCDLHPAGHISEREEADQNNYQSYTPNHWPLWPMENLKLYSTVILVVTNGHRHRSFLQIMWKVSYKQNQHAETTRVSTQLAYARQAMAVSGYGLHGTIAQVTRQ